MAVLSAGTLNGNATRDGSAARAPTRQYPRAIEDAVHLRQFATRLRETARTQSVRTTHRHLAATLWPGFIAEMQQPIGPRIQRYAGNPWPWMGSLLTCSRVTLADRAETVLVRPMRGITTILTRHGPLKNDRVLDELTARMPVQRLQPAGVANFLSLGRVEAPSVFEYEAGMRTKDVCVATG